ncbi:retinol-binding protein pinta [Stomoxys calcitrans]|uniref:retinol-binding protein pinta n=1 Tax=Stomoxys calcitrans TaxID=35570 RepID=UPI0027E2F68A|nr:retinol-binding protein pinta [Stomoxys calcitrans]
MSKLTNELQALAQKNCNETTEIRENSLVSLSLWMKKTSHLKARANEEWLVSFLRYSRFSVEETKKRLDNFYTLKGSFPEVMMNRSIDDSLLTLFRQGIHTIPRKPVTPEGPCIIISQYSKYDPKKYNPKDAFKLLFMLLEILANENANASISGLVYIVDARDVIMEQMLQYHPALLKKTLMLIEHCLPLRFVEIHLINMRKEGQTVFNFVTSLMPKKLPFKFVVHQKAEDLYQHIPRDAMTVEYGGHNGYQSEALKHWEVTLLKYKDYFASDDSFGVNEKLRVGINSSLEVSQLTGLNGSFRKLDVD